MAEERQPLLQDGLLSAHCRSTLSFTAGRGIRMRSSADMDMLCKAPYEVYGDALPKGATVNSLSKRK